MFALSMLLLIFGLIVVAVDLSDLYHVRVRLDNVAVQAAVAGASQVVISPSSGENGSPPQLGPNFSSTCTATASSMSGGVGAVTTHCTIVTGTADEVMVTVTAQVPMPIPIPFLGGSIRVSASSKAAPVLGGQAPAP